MPYSIKIYKKKLRLLKIIITRVQYARKYSRETKIVPDQTWLVGWELRLCER